MSQADSAACVCVRNAVRAGSQSSQLDRLSFRDKRSATVIASATALDLSTKQSVDLLGERLAQMRSQEQDSRLVSTLIRREANTYLIKTRRGDVRKHQVT